MLRSVLDLAEVQVGEIMVHRKDVAMINAGQSADKMVEEVLASPFTRIPLWQGQPDNIVGVLHAKALLRAVRVESNNGEKSGIKGIDVVSLAAKPWFIPEQTTLLDQLHEFRKRREHFALMVDEYGSFMGIVTLEDILEQLGLKDHEAVFVAHQETDHPHVHVICNLVNPNDGRTAVPSYDFLTHSKWAEAYEKEHGKDDSGLRRGRRLFRRGN